MKRLLLASAGALFLACASANAQAPSTFTVYFGFDRATLDEAGREVVDAAARNYREAGAARVEVSGYTDTAGSASYNRDLSLRRADAVRAALVERGVPSSAIAVDAEGENDLAVATGDDQREQRNRRVEIVMEAPPAPPPPVAQAAPVQPPSPEPMTSEFKPGEFSVGALYGFNMEDQGGTGSDEKDSHLAGLNLGFEYGITRWAALSVEQAAFYNFFSGDSGFGGRSAAGLDFTMGLTNVIPHVGGNIGYIYGSGINDAPFAGPEVGINLFGFDAKVAYDMPFNRSPDDGIIVATVGLGLRF